MDTPMWGGAVTRQGLLQSICLFQTLDNVPESPKNNASEAENDPKYCMSISREREVTSNLAFISSVSDNCLRVTAVCLEEHSNKQGVTIRIASNSGDMVILEQGFKKMAKVLEQAARGGMLLTSATLMLDQS